MSGRPLEGRPDTGDTPSRGVEMMLSMIQQVGRLAPRVHFERSFKLSPGQISPDRLLFGIERPRGPSTVDAGVDTLCRSLGMPVDYLRDFQAARADANHVYFGAERDRDRLTFKAYLEFRDKIAAQAPEMRNRHQAQTLYVGYKWDASDASRCAVSHYDWFYGLSPGDIQQRVQRLIGSGLQSLAASIVARAAGTLDPQTFQYLEVVEAANPRRSFDINVYKMGLRLADWLPSLQEAKAQFALPGAAFDALLARIGSERAGHFAAGTDRSGKGFLTVYYGGTALDGQRLASATLSGIAA